MAITMAIAAASLIAACGDGGAQTAEQSPTAETVVAAMRTPTAEPSPAPPAPPSASPTAAPASNIPVPTRAAVRTPIPVPTSTPLPTPTNAEALVLAASDALFEAQTWAFDVSAVITLADGGEVRVEMSGDYLDGAFMLGKGSAQTESGAFDLRLARFEEVRYAMPSGDDDDNDGWRELDAPPPFDMFADADALLRADGLQDAGREMSGGAELDAVSGKASPYGSGAEFDAVYLFGAQDGALREIRIAGEMDAGAFAFALGDSGAASASGKATVDATAIFSDFGKPVALASPRMIFPAFDHAAFALADGRVMVLGGASGIANNGVIAPFPIPLPQFYDFADSLWSLGLTSAELYDPDLSESLLFPAGFFHSAIALDNGALATAGFGGDDELASLVREFNPDSGEWRTLAGMETARGAPVLALLADGSLMAAGGLDLESLIGGDAQPRAVDAAEIYDRASDSWRTAAAMSGGASPGMTLLALADGRALALPGDPDAGDEMRDLEDGGRVVVDLDAGADGNAARTAVPPEIYDPETDSWTPTAPPEISRAEPTAILLADGRALITGAGVERREIDNPNAAGYETIPAFAAEIYDPATDSWTPTAPMMEFRASHTLTLLPDGRVLAAGGQDPRTRDYAIHATTEIYDPATNEWTAGIDMSEPRMSHSATLIPNGGGVFISGGVGVHRANGEIYPLNGAEVVDGG